MSLRPFVAPAASSMREVFLAGCLAWLLALAGSPGAVASEVDGIRVTAFPDGVTGIRGTQMANQMQGDTVLVLFEIDTNSDSITDQYRFYSFDIVTETWSAELAQLGQTHDGFAIQYFEELYWLPGGAIGAFLEGGTDMRLYIKQVGATTFTRKQITVDGVARDPQHAWWATASGLIGGGYDRAGGVIEGFVFQAASDTIVMRGSTIFGTASLVDYATYISAYDAATGRYGATRAHLTANDYTLAIHSSSGTTLLDADAATTTELFAADFFIAALEGPHAFLANGDILVGTETGSGDEQVLVWKMASNTLAPIPSFTANVYVGSTNSVLPVTFSGSQIQPEGMLSGDVLLAQVSDPGTSTWSIVRIPVTATGIGTVENIRDRYRNPWQSSWVDMWSLNQATDALRKRTIGFGGTRFPTSGGSWTEGVAVITPLPTVTLTASATALGETTTVSSILTVQRSGDYIDYPLTVALGITGSATRNSDYSLAGSTLGTISGVTTVIIPANVTSTTVTLTVIDDTAGESNETVVVQINPNLLPDNTYNLRNRMITTGASTRTLTISSEDPTGIAVTVATSGPNPTNTTIPVTITFAAAVSGFVDGEMTVLNGSAGSLSGSGDTYTTTVTPTASGVVTISVAANVATAISGGTANSASNTLSVTYDVTPPLAPSALDLAVASDSGSSTTDNITNATTPIITGVASGDAVEVRLFEGGTLLGTASVSANAWTITSTTLVGEGAHVLTAKARDALGNESGASTSLTITVDTVAPTVTTAISPAVLATATGFTGTITWNEAVTGFTASDLTLTNATVAALAGGPTSFTSNLTAVAPGSLGFSIAASVVTDVAGNVNSSGAALVSATYTPAPLPTITINGASDPTNVSPIQFQTEFSQTVSGFDISDLQVTNGTAGTFVETIPNVRWTFSVTPVVQGTVTVTVGAGAATAVSGGLSSVAANPLSVAYDSTAPAVAITTPAQTTGDPTPTISGTAEAGVAVQLHEGVTLLGSATATIGGTWTIDSAALAEGAHTLVATATDAAGNAGTSLSVVITVDLTPPAVAITSGASTTNDPTPTVSGTAEMGATVTLREGSTVLGTTIAAGGTWSITASTLPDGLHALFARAVDAYGNAADTATVAITIDTVAPSVALGTPSATSNVNVDDTVTIVVTYADAGSGLDAVSLATGDVTVTSATGNASATAAISGSGNTRTITLTGFTGDGTLTVSLAAGTAADVAGNSAAAAGPSLAIAVDNTAPIVAITTGTTITADDTPTIAGTSNDAASTIELRNGTTVLGTGAVTAGVWSITPTTALVAGTYVLTARGTDAAGNVGSDSAPLSITVNLSGPTVVISGGTISGTTATFIATFSAPVTGLTAGEIVIGGTAGGTKVVTIAADATNRIFTITVSGLAAPSGTVTVQIPADVAAALAGDPTLPSNSLSVAFTVPVPVAASGSSSDGGCGGGSGFGLLMVLVMSAMVRLQGRRG